MMFRLISAALAARLHRRARRLSHRRPPDLVIGPPEAPYLSRWHLIPRNRLVNVYLHRFHRDDDDRALHDHPWPSASLALSGALIEVYRGPRGFTACRRVRPGVAVLRRASFAHRIEVLDGPAWTLFITGPKVREWGFICPQGWRHWREYVRPGRPGEIGRGCE